jgi:hypothetical protein
MIRVLNTAYAVLSDPEKRSLYDEYGCSALSDEAMSREQARMLIALANHWISAITASMVGCIWLPLRTIATICKTSTTQSSLRVLIDVYYSRGSRGLYSGLIPTILFNFCSTTIKYPLARFIKNVHIVEYIGISAFYPLLVATTCLRTGLSRGILSSFKHITHSHGVLALWTGIAPWILSGILFQGTLYIMDEVLDLIYARINPSHHSNPTAPTAKDIAFSLASIVTKCVACVAITSPLEAITYQSQTQLFVATSSKVLNSKRALFGGFVSDCLYYLLKGL